MTTRTESPASAFLPLTARAEQVAAARAFVRELLGPWRPCAETAELLVSELVTNSIRHSGSGQSGQEITVTVIPQRGGGEASGVRIEVTDRSGPTIPEMRNPADTAEGGRGLQLVQALAASWGFQRAGDRTTTWFVIQALLQPMQRSAVSVKLRSVTVCRCRPGCR